MQYIAKLMLLMASVGSPLRELLNKDGEWHWHQEQDLQVEGIVLVSVRIFVKKMNTHRLKR